MDPPTEGTGTSDSQVEVVWNAVTDAGTPTGNSAITAYKLLWDNGDGAAVSFIELTLTTALATSHTIVGITEGASYRFTVQAENIYGESAASTIATIRASGVPSQPPEVVTTRDGLNLVLQSTAPSSNGAAITDNEVLLYSPNTDSYVEDAASCDGSGAGFEASRQCTFLFTYLMSTYGYTRNQLVLFKTRSENDDGWGVYSNPNSGGQVIMTVPA
jgi:hypothetical protein